MTRSVPLFEPEIDEREVDAIARVIRSKWLAMGSEVDNLEMELADLLDVRHAVALSSCTAALHLAYFMTDIKSGDEVIVPSLTFAATANAVTYVGAEPVFADIVSADDLTIDPNDVERRITDRTKAIVAMHHAGHPCDMKALEDICRKYNLVLLEDACHGLGGTYDGRAMGTIGLAGCFSFYTNKVMTTGEGGALVTNDDDIAERARRLRTHGQTKTAIDREQGALGYDITEIGFNYRMDDIRGALGRVQLSRIAGSVNHRRALYRRYRENIAGIDGVHMPTFGARGEPAHYILPIVLDREDRHEIREQLAAFGVQTSVHYPPVHLFAHYAKVGRSLPVTENVASRSITLPLYATMSESDVDRVCEVLSEIVEKG